MAASVTPAAPTPTPTGTTPGAGSAATGATNASAAFAALMGSMFGDQDSLAAQLLAGAKPGAKTEGGQVPTTTTTEETTDTGAQAQALAGAFGVVVAPVLVDQAQTVAAGEAQATTPTVAAQAGVDANATVATPTPGVATGQTTADPATTVADASTAAPKTTGVPLPAAASAEAAAVAAQPTAAVKAAIQAATTEAPPPVAPQAVARTTTNTDKAAATVDASATAVDAPAETGAAKPAVVASATPDGAQGDSGKSGAETNLPKTEVAAREAASERKETAQPAPPTHAASHAATVNPTTAAPVRGSPETVAHLAAQIAKHLEGRTTQFDIQLTPQGLGHVSVRVEISAHGQLTAAMGFDNPNAAAEVRNRAAELTRALEQAGFDVSGGLSFDVAGDQGRPGQGMNQQQDDNAGAWRGRAFQAALDAAGETVDAAVTGALNLQRRSLAGVDIRI